jgi:predicted MFS family arabinose efflux permease
VPWPLALGAVLVLAGMAVGGLFVTLYVLVGELAPTGVGTRVYAWLVTANNGGLALGAGLAGVLVAARGPAAGLWLGAGFAFAGVITALAAKSRS